MPALSLLPPLFRDFPVAETVQLAQLAEHCGYSGAWYADERFQRDTYAVLVAMAAATETLQLGPAVTDPYSRHPAITAAAIATVSELAPKRTRLGMGAGVAGFENLEIQLRRPAVAVSEAIQAIRGLLAGESVTVAGDVIRLHDGKLKFRTSADVPVYLAAEGPAMLRTAARSAEAVIIAHTAVAQALREKLMKAGPVRRARPDPLRIVARLDATVNHDGQRALDAARVRVGRVLWAAYPRLEWLTAAGAEIPRELDRRLRQAGRFHRTHDLTPFRQFASAIPDDIVRLIALAGTPDEVSVQLRALFDGGVHEVMAHPLLSDGVDIQSAIRLLGQAYAGATASDGGPA